MLLDAPCFRTMFQLVLSAIQLLTKCSMFCRNAASIEVLQCIGIYWYSLVFLSMLVHVLLVYTFDLMLICF
jgi:hypothetical protein